MSTQAAASTIDTARPWLPTARRRRSRSRPASPARRSPWPAIRSFSASGARLAGLQREPGQAQPQHQPQPRAARAPTALAAVKAAPSIAGIRAVRGPQQHGEQRVDDHRAWRAVDRVRRPVQHPAEALAEPPDAQRPGDRRGEREPGQRAERDAEPEQQLDRREDRVQRDGMVVDEGGVPGDRPGDDAGIARAVAASIWPNARVNMTGWYCSRASSSQMPARPSCSARRASGASRPARTRCPAFPATRRGCL